MSLDGCADLVARGDPDRFDALMAMPRAARARLLPLFAFHIEISRAPLGQPRGDDLRNAPAMVARYHHRA